MEFILASANTYKAQELNKLAQDSSLQFAPADKKITVEEDGITFEENALKKAKAYFHQYNRPVVADDSGLVVHYLPNELGLHSARFGGEGLDDEGRARLLLDRLHEVESDQERSAYFICYLCFMLSEDEIYFFEGRLNGHIARAYRGTHGFGYDPVFVPEGYSGETLAELPDFKKSHSHRAVAMRYAREFFKERHRQKT